MRVPRCAGLVLGAGLWILGPFAVACGDGDSSVPLGGPYGGRVYAPPPSDTANKGTGVLPAPCAPPPDSGAAPAAATSDGGAPHWSDIFTDYMWTCADVGCHIEMATPSSAYAWLKSQGYISGASSSLVDPTTSCLQWFGGDMPPCTASSDQAVSDISAWVAAGALDN